MLNRFRRKPRVIKFEKNLINFAALCPNQNDTSQIKYSNDQIFEMYNPKNKFQLSTSYDVFNKYAKLFRESGDSLFYMNEFTNLVSKIRSSFGKYKSDFIKDILEEDVTDINVSRNDIRLALMKDLNCKVSVVFVKNSINPVDFCLDSNVPYDQNKCEGIVLNEHGFLNPSEICATVFINKNYLASVLDSVNNDIEISDYIKDVKTSLFAAILKDGHRIEFTEKFMRIVNLLGKSNLGFLNTTRSDFADYTDEKFNTAKKDFVELYKDEIDSVTNNEIFAKALYNIRSNSNNINPVDILTIIELSDKVVNDVLVSGEKSDTNINKFISSFDLIETDEDKNVDNIKKMILTARLLPILHFCNDYLYKSNTYRIFKKIDEALEHFIHNAGWSLDVNFSPLKELHYTNDEYYDSIRNIYKDPMKNTQVIVDAFNRCIVFSKDDKCEECEDCPCPVEVTTI